MYILNVLLIFKSYCEFNIEFIYKSWILAIDIIYSLVCVVTGVSDYTRSGGGGGTEQVGGFPDPGAGLRAATDSRHTDERHLKVSKSNILMMS